MVQRGSKKWIFVRSRTSSILSENLICFFTCVAFPIVVMEQMHESPMRTRCRHRMSLRYPDGSQPAISSSTGHGISKQVRFGHRGVEVCNCAWIVAAFEGQRLTQAVDLIRIWSFREAEKFVKEDALLIGAELGPVNYRPQSIGSVDITRVGAGSRPALIVTPPRCRFCCSSQALAP